MSIDFTLLLLLLLLLSSTTFAQKKTSTRMIKISSVSGPESLAFDRLGHGPYTGVSDGRILKWQGHIKGWRNFAALPQWSQGLCSGSDESKESTCGRPLGLQFNRRSGELYIADAYFGLLVVGPQGGIARQLAAAAGGVPFMFTNGLDVDETTGLVYFTDSSSRFQRWENEMVVVSGDATGRFMKYDPGRKELTVLLSGLTFPNGVAVSQDGSFVLIAGTTNCTVSRYWLRGPKAGEFELFAELPGYPDNIKINDEGEFWVAINRQRIRFDAGAAAAPPEPAAPAAVKLSREGTVVEVVDGTVMSPVSEVEDRNGTLWLGSVELPYVGLLRDI